MAAFLYDRLALSIGWNMSQDHILELQQQTDTSLPQVWAIIRAERDGVKSSSGTKFLLV